MDTKHDYLLDELSPEVAFFRQGINSESIKLSDVERYYEQDCDSLHILGKDERSVFKGINTGYAKLQNLKERSEAIGMTDYDMSCLELNKLPSTFQEEDKACMQGTFTKNCYRAVFPGPTTLPILCQSKKIPVLQKKKPIGILAICLNITQAFLKLEEIIKNEHIAPKNLPMHDKLTQKEISALKLYNQGVPRKIAAKKLNIAESTYAWYLREIRLKFGIRTRTEMLMLEQHFK